MSPARLTVLTAAVALAALPLAWVARHRGARRDRAREGRADGVLLLGALACAAFALVLAAVAVARDRREARRAAAWRPVDARLGDCTVAERRGGRGGRSYELACDARVVAGGGVVVRRVTAGHPARRAGYDAWIAAHPPGSTLRLWQDPRDPATVVGLDLVAPATTTARSAADQALGFGAVAAALLAASRAVVARRRGRAVA